MKRDQVAEEGLAIRDPRVVAERETFVDLEEAPGDHPQALALDTRQDLTDESTPDGVRLGDDERAFHWPLSVRDASAERNHVIASPTV